MTRLYLRGGAGSPLHRVKKAGGTGCHTGQRPHLVPLSIVLTASFFGLGPSIFCCILSLFVWDYYFLPPLHTLFTFNFEVVAISLVFISVGLIISYLSSRLHKKTAEATREADIRHQSEVELITYRGRLEELVKERTAALERSYTDLTREIAEHRKDEQALKESEERLGRGTRSQGLGLGLVVCKRLVEA